MLADPDRPLRFREIWFNSYNHLRPFVPHETFGAAQGDKLSELMNQALSVWNKSFRHEAVVARFFRSATDRNRRARAGSNLANAG